MDIVRQLELIANGFESQKLTVAQAKSAIPAFRQAIDEIRLLRRQIAAIPLRDKPIQVIQTNPDNTPNNAI